jgi:hypothetical protein
MVYHNTDSLSLAFAALADPRRRASIDRLASERQLAVLTLRRRLKAPPSQGYRARTGQKNSALDETARHGHERWAGRLEKLDQYLS